jgi:hypothetical protein
MALFTLILEHAGGTYCAQVVADDPAAALQRWATTFEQRIEAVDESTVVELRHLLNRDVENDVESIVPLYGLESIWCWTSDDALVNIIETARN